MTLSKNIARASAPVVGGVVLGSMGAAAGAFAGGVGAAILKSSGYDGYNPIEAAQMGAVGGAVLDGSVGVLVGALASCGLFSSSNKSDNKESNTKQTAVGYVAGTVIAGLTGYGIMNAGNNETVMQLAQTAASFAVGGAVTMIPASCALICITVPLVVAAAYLAKKEEEHISTPSIGSNAV